MGGASFAYWCVATCCLFPRAQVVDSLVSSSSQHLPDPAIPPLAALLFYEMFPLVHVAFIKVATVSFASSDFVDPCPIQCQFRRMTPNTSCPVALFPDPRHANQILTC